MNIGLDLCIGELLARPKEDQCTDILYTLRASLQIFERRIFFGTRTTKKSGLVFAVRWEKILRYLRLKQIYASHPSFDDLGGNIKPF